MYSVLSFYSCVGLRPKTLEVKPGGLDKNDGSVSFIQYVGGI